MTATPLEDLLSVETLTGLVRRFADQSENRICTDLFERHARAIRPLGQVAKWEEIEFSRSFAPVTGIDSPHTQARRLGRKQRASVMVMVKVYKDLPGSHLWLSRAPGEDTADAASVLADELADAVNLVQNTKEYLACGALLGKIKVDPQLVPGSELSFEVDFKVPRFSSVDWSDPRALLRSRELRRLKRRYKDGAGQRAGLLIADERVEGLLVKNKEISGFAKEVLSRQILQGGSVGKAPQWKGLGGLDWQFVDGTYQPEGGAVTSYWPEDVALLLPPERRLRKVLGWAEGTVLVPSGDVFAPAESALGMVREARGHYAYARLRDDPIGIRLYVGWYGLPVVLDPQSLLRVNVRPQAAPAVAL
ncbi:MAG: major capsid protein [Planctomycetes bacterium]|nr:major capsid protein [Planctomycetota bacterium]